MNQYPRETLEFQPVTVTVDGVAVTANVEHCVTPNGVRPATWIAPVTVSGKQGVMVQALTPGFYDVWVRVTSSPEVPVLLAGQFQIT